MRYFFSIVLLCLIFSNCREKKELEFQSSISVPELLNFPSEGNSVKIFDVAHDSMRKRLYVHSILTSSIAVIDTEANTLEKYLESGLTGYHISYMEVHSKTGDLYIIDDRSHTLTRFDPDGNQVLNQIELESSPSRIGIQSEKDFVLVTFASQDRLRVYDGGLNLVKELDSTDKMYGPQGIFVDSSNDEKVYVALGRDRSDRYDDQSETTYSGVAEIDLSSWSVSVRSVPYKGAVEITGDAETGRFWLLSENRVRYLSSSESRVSRYYSEMELKQVFHDKESDRLYVLSRDGGNSEEDAAPYGSVEVLNSSNLDHLERLRVGMKTARGRYDPDGKRLFATNMASGDVSILSFSNGSDSSSEEVKVDVGSSLEDWLIDPTSDQAFLMSRLGGSEVHTYSFSSGTIVNTTRVKNWPTRLALNSQKKELYVLSHFSSSVEVLDTQSSQVIANIDMLPHGVEQNRTHYISDMILNSNAHRLYVSFPEQGLIIELDAVGRKVIRVVEGFEPVSETSDDADSSQTGRAQLAVDEETGFVFVYYRENRKLEVRDPSMALEVIQSFTISKSDLSDNDFQARLMFVDSGSRKLYIGNKIYRIGTDGLSHEGEISGIEKVIGVRGRYLFGAKISSDELSIAGFEETEGEWVEFLNDVATETRTIPPKVAIHPTEDEIWVGFKEYAELQAYSISE